MLRALALALLLTTATLAGCLGTEDGADVNQSAIPETAAPPAPAQEGDLVGSVVDVTQVPIPGAQVYMLRNKTFSTNVAQDGSYTLADVPPGEHLIRVDADGFLGQTFSVRIKSGQTTLLDVELEPEPTQQAYHESRELAGLLDCGLVFAGADNPTQLPCVNFDPNARSVFDIDVAPQPARILLELVWEPNQPLAERLHLDAQTIGTGTQDIELGDAEGPSVLRLNIPGPLLERHYEEGGKFRVNVTAAHSFGDEEGAALGAAIEQEFTLIVTTFFVESGPSDFSALEGE